MCSRVCVLMNPSPVHTASPFVIVAPRTVELTIALSPPACGVESDGDRSRPLLATPLASHAHLWLSAHLHAQADAAPHLRGTADCVESNEVDLGAVRAPCCPVCGVESDGDRSRPLLATPLASHAHLWLSAHLHAQATAAPHLRGPADLIKSNEVALRAMLCLPTVCVLSCSLACLPWNGRG